MLGSAAERFTLGPFSEVAASRHGWEELAPHLDRSPAAATFAHERVVRGDDLRGDERALALPSVFDLPLVLEAWEPVYPSVEYLPDRARFPAPDLPALGLVEVFGLAAPAIDDPSAVEALLGVVGGWRHESDDPARAFAVEGDARGAIAAAGAESGRLAKLTAEQALAVITWAGASGGALGRRRGMAAGRSTAWWLATVLTGLGDDPDCTVVSPDELGDAIGELRWYLWDGGDAKTGWSMRLAVEDPAEGLAWALRANDGPASATDPTGAEALGAG